jgi:hypothetical protein
MPKEVTVWTDEARQTAIGMKRAGLKSRQIAARLGLTVAAVEQFFYKLKRDKQIVVPGRKGVAPGPLPRMSSDRLFSRPLDDFESIAGRRHDAGT